MWTLARKLLVHDRLRFAVAIAGVSVSVMLVLVQIGLYFGFMATASSLIDASTADLWVTGRASDVFEFASPFDERTLYQVASVAGVERAEPVLINFTSQYKRPNGGNLGVLIVGVDASAAQPLLAPWHVIAGDARELYRAGAIAVDRSDAGKLGVAGVGNTIEIAGVRADVVALTAGIRSFTTNPIVFADIRSARAFLTGATETMVSYVLVRVAPGAAVAAVQQRIDAIPHFAAYTTHELSQRTRSYWSSRTGIGATLFTTALLGVIVGIVVVGQILYSNTLQYLREFATLKALGAANRAIVAVIAQQAAIAGALGFVSGGLLALGLRAGLAAANLTVVLSPALYVATFATTVAMCAVAALLSIVRVLRLDPASVFQS